MPVTSGRDALKNTLNRLARLEPFTNDQLYQMAVHGNIESALRFIEPESIQDTEIALEWGEIQGRIKAMIERIRDKASN